MNERVVNSIIFNIKGRVVNEKKLNNLFNWNSYYKTA